MFVTERGITSSQAPGSDWFGLEIGNAHTTSMGSKKRR